MSSFKTWLELEIKVEYEYSPGEEPSDSSDGSNESVDIQSVTIGKDDKAIEITHLLTEGQMQDLSEEAAKDANDTASENKLEREIDRHEQRKECGL
jgi:hypothetical protein